MKEQDLYGIQKREIMDWLHEPLALLKVIPSDRMGWFSHAWPRGKAVAWYKVWNTIMRLSKHNEHL